MITNLKVQIEDDRRIEEELKEQLEVKRQDHWKFGSTYYHINKVSSKEKYAEQLKSFG
jgi:hypothetical protein